MPGAFMDVFMQAGRSEPPREQVEVRKETVSPTEDLMKEHGLVERILIMYQRLIDRAAGSQEVDISVIKISAKMIYNYVNNHHERNEERYVFPRFREADYIMDMVNVLKIQHERSRKIAKEMIDISSTGSGISTDDRKRLLSLCSAFVYMYLPHIAHENTILFPAFYDIVSADEMREIGEKMEDEEEKLLGEAGFRGLVGQVSELEKFVGVNELDRFTAQL